MPVRPLDMRTDWQKETDMKGCVGCLAILGAMFLLAALLDIGGCIGKKLGELAEWRDTRLAEKAKQAEAEKAKRDAAVRLAEEERQKAAAAAEAKRRQAAKDDKIQAFALKDAPKVWEVYQALKSEIDVQNGKIEELRKTLVAFGKDPEQDMDFKRICALRDDMIRSRAALRAKLEDAYIAAKKYEASPSRKDYQDTMKRALEDGIQDANMATERYKAMTRQK